MEKSTANAGERLAQFDELELEIEKLVSGGDGMGRFEGIPIFVPRSAPGDRLRVRLVDRRSGYGRAEIIEVVAAGPDRRSPPCAHFDRCGGCDLQHLDDRAQVRLKAEATLETLRRLGRIALPESLRVIAGEPWTYRQRAQVHCRTEGEEVEVGYFERGSHQLVAVRECPVLVPDLEEVVTDLPQSLAPEAPRRIDLVVGSDGTLSTAPALKTHRHGPVTVAVGDFEIEFDARCFFQGHRGLMAELVEAVVGDDEGGAACDLYAGVGLFSLPLARRYREVTAVDGDRVAARYARRNARRNGVVLDVVAQAVESWVEGMPSDLDRVVVDPPRAGLSRGVAERLIATAPTRLTYVSCHAATLARDLARLGERFSLRSLVLLDLFPQTGHMEVVAQLALRGTEES